MKITQFVLGDLMTNTYLVSDEETKKCFIVDPAAPSKELEAKIETEELIPEYIILTHGHVDHTGGIYSLKAAYPDIVLVASRDERDLLKNKMKSYSSKTIIADKEVTDGDELNVGSLTLKFISTPGHTPGGMSILVDNVLFSGDTLFRTSVGRTDFQGGDFSTLMSSIREKLFALPDDTVVLPGHDVSTTIGYEKRYNPFV